jgi:glyoxylase-like metal-dependent hydrolase (beta-lactamase superfamily II)
MYVVSNRDLVKGEELRWWFEPIKSWYPYKLVGRAMIVEVEPPTRVTWEVVALPGFFARHTYTLEDLGDGRTRFGSWEQAMGPTLRATLPFWRAHFEFVKDRSLQGASYLEAVYRRHGRIDSGTLQRRTYVPFSQGFRRVARMLKLLRVEYRELLPGLHVALGGGGNSLILTDGGETMVVDTKQPPLDRRLKRWIDRNIEAPVTTVVNTHFHFDHTQGNILYAGARIIAHAVAPALMRERDGRIWRKRPDGMPGELIEETTTIHVGSQPVTIHADGRGHTASDLWLHIERDGRHVIMTGDVACLGVNPYFDTGEGGADIEHMIALLRRWATDYPDAVFVPGHGPVATASDMRYHADFLAFLIEHVGRAKRAGLSARQTVSNLSLSPFRLSPMVMFHGGQTFLNERSNIRQTHGLLT